jgi:thiosulfate/3-mercaptopyruvate sulfurtransferase
MIRQTIRSISILSLAFVIFFGCSPAEQEEILLTYPNHHLLIEAWPLMDLLQSSSNLILIDAREETGEEYLPGAIHFPAVRNLTDHDHPVASFLIGPEEFQEKMREIGLDNQSPVVIYDDGNNLASARLFYALENYGFSNAYLLNGGIQGWKASGLRTIDYSITREPGTFTINRDEPVACDISYIMEAVNDPNKIIFDARSAAEFTGEEVRAERGGHIPNAVNLEWNKVLEPEGVPYFLPAANIQKLLAERGITPDKEVIPHCHTNVRGSHAYFTLRLMGYDSVRPYEGSWAEYGNRADVSIQ